MRLGLKEITRARHKRCEFSKRIRYEAKLDGASNFFNFRARRSD